MFTLITPTGSLDDVVFEGRNQAYGAFQLRRSYQRHLGAALTITVVACSLLLLLPLAIRYFAPVPPPPAARPSLPASLLKPQIYAMPTAKPVLSAALHPAIAVRAHSVIRTQIARDSEVKPTAEPTLPPDVGPTGPATPGAANTTGAGAAPGLPAPGPDSAMPAPAAAPLPVLTAEVMPDFVGGRTALQRYLQKHLRFPAAARAAQVSGRVFVSFVVQTDGSIGEVQVLKGLGYGTDEAAARVVREMPAWTPGLQNRHAVPVRFTLPITFQFE